MQLERRIQRVSSVTRWLVQALPSIETVGQLREALWAYVYISPWLLGMVLFVIGPIFVSIFLSFTDYGMIKPPVFIGLDNFTRAFTEDKLFWPSLFRTFYYAIIYVPIVIFGSLSLAILMNQKLTGTTIFRTLFFMPHLTPSVALGVLWVWILHPHMGPVNAFLDKLGLPQPGWLTSPAWAMPSIIMMSLWAGCGGNRMLIFLAGLQGVPQELYEASEIDGAGRWAKTRYVTLPMISPVVFFNAVLAVISSLQVFNTAFVATQGGPAYATWFFVLHIYNHAFKYYRLGYGSTLAWILAVIIVSLSYVQIRLSGRWVYYAGG